MIVLVFGVPCLVGVVQLGLTWNSVVLFSLAIWGGSIVVFFGILFELIYVDLKILRAFCKFMEGGETNGGG